MQTNGDQILRVFHRYNFTLSSNLDWARLFEAVRRDPTPEAVDLVSHNYIIRTILKIPRSWMRIQKQFPGSVTYSEITIKQFKPVSNKISYLDNEISVRVCSIFRINIQKHKWTGNSKYRRWYQYKCHGRS